MNSIELVSPDGKIEKSPYNLTVYYCVVQKIVHRQFREDYGLIEPFLDELQNGLEWCEKWLKGIDKKLYEHDKKEIEGYLKEMIRFYNMIEPLKCGRYLKCHKQVKKYLN